MAKAMYINGSRNKGIYLALITAIISGVSIFINKFAVTAIASPLVFTSIKNTGVAVLIIGIVLIRGKWKKIAKLSKREASYLLIIGIVGGSIPFYLFFTGLSTIPAINGAIINKTMVLWAAVLAVLFLKEKVSKKGWLIICLLFAANILVGGFKGFTFSTGEGLVLLATILWAVETILAKKILPRVDPDIVAVARMGFGALILLTMSSVLQPFALSNSLSLTSTQWFWLALTMLTLLGYVTMWYRALKFAPVTTVTAILVGATIITNILSAIFVTHTINILMVLQGLLIISGITILSRTESVKHAVLDKVSASA